MTKLISLTELIRTSSGDIENKRALVNVEGIVSVQESKLERKGPVIIGQTDEPTMFIVSLTTGARLFVKESLEEIADLVFAAAA